MGDLHVSKNSQGAFQALFSQISGAADVLLLCGDFTDYGLPDEARVLVRELNAALKVPVIAVLGNHDFEGGKPQEIRQILVDGGVTVLDGRGATDTTRLAGKATLTREPGYYPLTIRFRSLADVSARLQLCWEGPAFAAEVIPAWRFGNVDKELSPAAQQDILAARGRTLVGKFGCARCHVSAMPAVTDPPPGPSLADAGKRLNRVWLLDWLADPAKVRPDAHMPRSIVAAVTGI